MARKKILSAMFIGTMVSSLITVALTAAAAPQSGATEVSFVLPADPTTRPGTYAIYETEDTRSGESGDITKNGGYRWEVLNITSDVVTVGESHSVAETALGYEYSYEIDTRRNINLTEKAGADYYSLLWIPRGVTVGTTVDVGDSRFTVVESEKIDCRGAFVDTWKLTGALRVSEQAEASITAYYEMQSGILVMARAVATQADTWVSRGLVILSTNAFPMDWDDPAEPELLDTESGARCLMWEPEVQALPLPLTLEAVSEADVRPFPHTPPYGSAYYYTHPEGGAYTDASVENSLGEMRARVKGEADFWKDEYGTATAVFGEDWVSPVSGDVTLGFHFSLNGVALTFATWPTTYGYGYCMGTVSIIGTVTAKPSGEELGRHEWVLYHDAFFGGMDAVNLAMSDVFEIPVTVTENGWYFYRFELHIIGATQSQGVVHEAQIDLDCYSGDRGGILRRVDGPRRDTTPPVVSITSPLDGDVVCGTVPVYVDASDNVSVHEVEFYVDGAMEAVDGTYPYRWNWDTSVCTDGPHTIKAVAYDAANSSAMDTITVVVDNLSNLDILEVSLFDAFSPANPWSQEGLVEVFFTVASPDVDLSQITFGSDDLIHTDLPKKISGHSVNFTPHEIDYLAVGNTADVTAYIQIPMGQHEGVYRGTFRASGAGGCAGGYDAVAVEIQVSSLADIDMDRESVALTAYPEDSDLGLFVVVNPNGWHNNVDPVDGPGNTDLSSLSYYFTDLTGPAGLIPASAVGVWGDETSLASGASDEVVVSVSVPPGQLAGCYWGQVYVQATPTSVDSLTLGMTVMPHLRLDISETSITGTVSPQTPWPEALSAELAFNLTNTGNDTLKNVIFTATDLELADHPPLHGGDVEFDPSILSVLAPGVGLTVGVSIPVPVGHHQGAYTGTVQATAGGLQAASDVTIATVTVGGLADIDIQDYSNNMTANEMHLIGCGRSVVVGSFDLINPNHIGNNVDIFDGPGNVTILNLDAEWGDLLSYGENHSIHRDNVSLVTALLDSLPSGHAEKIIVQVNIPRTAPSDKTYTTTLEVSGEGMGVPVSDEMTLKVTVVPTGSGGSTTSSFWINAGDGENLLEWTDFCVSEIGYNVYRCEEGAVSFQRLNSSTLETTVYSDMSVLPGMVYQYKIGLVLAGGREVLVGPVSVEVLEPLPKAFALMQNYPNPFHQGTNIRFQMPVSGRARLSIYDPAGRLMRILMDADTEPGDHTVTWDGRDGTGRRISAGVYFYRLTTDSFTATKKMVVIR